ncbi:hypothetical protein I3271_05485 [Photobacterium leiognathi]|uniref:hypothetical protein n=1 Tax=Photobacterium leiognathi TaxID=553611 RepID=UPI001EDFFBF0|nr:hypothetical protein [Photobacterium leiognathi]MCG3884133.1 hypothetical protein [Photobacterium leiognathi]
MNTLEKLNPELIGYIEECHFMTFFRHPLCVMPYSKGTEDKELAVNGMINTLVSGRTKIIMDLESKGDYASILHLVERPFRLEYAIKYLHLVSDFEYWDIVDYVWTDSENPSVNLDLWERIFSNRKYSNPSLKSKTVNTLPKEVTIYRGGNHKGLSWTLDKSQAEWFAKRFDSNQTVMIATVNKADILHYTDSRGEQEIVASPSRVNVLFEEQLA